MDEKVFNKLISEYAIENANLRMAIISQDQRIKELEKKLKKKDKE